MRQVLFLKTINIMTSCDGNLMKYIPIQLESIEFNLKGRHINFYLFHDGQNISYVNKLKKIKYNNIKFHDVVIPEEEASKYELIASKGGGGVELLTTVSVLINIFLKRWIEYYILIRQI